MENRIRTKIMFTSLFISVYESVFKLCWFHHETTGCLQVCVGVGVDVGVVGVGGVVVGVVGAGVGVVAVWGGARLWVKGVHL